MARTPKDPQIRMDEILDIAEPLFASNGFRKTTISDIAQKMGVAQGMLYYYFKSKEEILESLMNRHISALLTDVRRMVTSTDILPPRKIEILIYATFHTAQQKEGLYLDFLSDKSNFHMKNKVFRQTILLLQPWLLKIIEEGISKKYFYTTHKQTTLNFIMSIILCLGDALCEKLPEEIIVYHVRMAERLIEKTLEIPEGCLHFSI